MTKSQEPGTNKTQRSFTTPAMRKEKWIYRFRTIQVNKFSLVKYLP